MRNDGERKGRLRECQYIKLLPVQIEVWQISSGVMYAVSGQLSRMEFKFASNVPPVLSSNW